jgi:phosphatidylglycerophosphate synthase
LVVIVYWAKGGGMSEIKDHERINDILLGPLERPALKWFAAHMPGWVNPDFLTLIGIIGTIMIFGGYWLSNTSSAFLWVASLGFVVNWFGDSLDGTLARFREIQRPKFGFFIDHVVDAYSQLFVFVGIGLSPYVRFEIASMTLVCYLLVSVLVYIQTSVKGVFQISYGKLGPTEVRVIAIGINTYIFFAGNTIFNLFNISLSIFEIVCLIISIALFSIFLSTSIKNGIELYKIDPPKQ